MLRSMAITECNMNPVNPYHRNKKFVLEKPLKFKSQKQMKEYNEMVSMATKHQQIISKKLVSEDLMIRSNKECLTDILPFMKDFESMKEIKHIITYY